MAWKKILFATSLLLSPVLRSGENESPLDKRQITYLLQSKEYRQGFELYQAWQKQLGRHDFELLQEIAQILLEEGARSQEAERQLVTIFAAGLSASAPSWEILESGIASQNPQTQVATIQLLGRLQDDRSDELLVKAMSSDLLYCRLEAAYFLALRKHRYITGQLEALMYRIPPEFRFFFPEFFALIGTADSISLLRHMMDEKEASVRTEAVLNAGRYGRDDLLPQIRSMATHLNIAEQEACAYALGELKDSKSLSLLQKLAASPSPSVRLAAFKSQYLLGERTAGEEIEKLALAKDLFAIVALGDIPDTNDLLAEFARDTNMQVRFNAALGLLKQRDPRALAPLLEFFFRDSRDLGFQPVFSLGRAHMAWKIVPSASQHSKQEMIDLTALSLSVREHLLRQCLELPEKDFLYLARILFERRESTLIPLLVNLLENLRTDEAINLLEERSQMAGAPLIRAYCNLALFRSRHEGHYEKQLMTWLQDKKELEMIRFRPMALRSSLRLPDSAFELTPEENSRLIVDTLEAIAERHEEKGIDLILALIKDGNPKNRPLLAGLLLRMIE